MKAEKIAEFLNENGFETTKVEGYTEQSDGIIEFKDHPTISISIGEEIFVVRETSNGITFSAPIKTNDHLLNYLKNQTRGDW
jgi:hypothetical protein